MIVKNIFIVLIFVFIYPTHVLSQHEGHSYENLNTKWTCSMHPHIQLGEPGQCPICGMNLIPVKQDKNSEGKSSLELSEEAEKLAEIQTTVVERTWVTRPVRLFGKIDYDETRLKHITAWVSGRIERMYVDYTGIAVKRSDHMVSIYSPELVSAQEEFLQATRSLRRVQGGSSKMVKRSSRRSFQAAKEKLKLLGLTNKQVSRLEKRGKSKDKVTIYSPIGGIVVEKHLNEGAYVETGTRIYTIADLSHLWLYLDAYESDLPWISYGQEVEFSTQALPGEKFSGVVSFVQPFLDEKTRTVKVRVNVNNESKRIKPGTFVTAIIHAQVDKHGKSIAKSYTGKFVCPMHPEIVKDETGDCPVCGMELARAETLPFVSAQREDKAEAPLVIPASAPLITGKRAVVYVKHPKRNQYHGREVTLGPRAGDSYIVVSGLKEGEIVVTKGAFKIDADLQIRGLRSMMNQGKQQHSHSH